MRAHLEELTLSTRGDAEVIEVIYVGQGAPRKESCAVRRWNITA